MTGKVSKLLGWLAAVLTVLVAGATGAMWLSTTNAKVTDGAVVQPSAESFSESQQPVVSQAAVPQSLVDFSVVIPPTAEMVIISERWAVSSTANVEEFPLEKSQVPALSCLSKDYASTKAFEDCLGETPGCTPAQKEWLSQNALKVNDKLMVEEGRLGLGNVTLTNTSTSAQSISFKDIRLKADFSLYPDAGFSIVCSNYNDWQGGATSGFGSWRNVLLPLDSEIAVFEEPSSYGEDLTRHIPAGMPAVFNLAAGETSNARLFVKIPYPVGTLSGRVVATVSAADGAREIVVPLPLLDGGESAYSAGLGPYLWVDGGTVCPDKASKPTKYTSMRTTCSIPQLIAQANVG